MSSQQRLYNPNLIFDPNAYWPLITYGECTRKRNHPYIFMDWLGDGLCDICWDAGYMSDREKVFNLMTKAKDKLEKKPSDEERQAIYKEAQESWFNITKDEDKELRFGGLFDV
mgnify:CR=1 FL=1|tara:strand:+ start:1370 stop:1708 length:339 start_codon:yes stop_codon:yes gene_type:complete